MIVGSLLLILVAVGLLVLGLANGSSGLLISSIGASLLAAVALVVGARQAAAMRIEVDATPREGFSPAASGHWQPQSPSFAAATTASTSPASGVDRSTGHDAYADEDPFIDPDPFGEPESSDRPDSFTGSDPFTHQVRTNPSDSSDRFRRPNPFDGPESFSRADRDASSDPLRRPNPFDGPDPVSRPGRGAADPFMRPDPFSDSDSPVPPSVPSQGGHPDEETRWRQPAEPYRRSARGAEQAGAADEADDEFAVVDIPPDEPDAQQVSATTAAQVATLTTDVMVIDGRPRYHLPSCPHLVGRECEPLPVGEAVELGFTPCGRCEPDSRLIADAGPV